MKKLLFGLILSFSLVHTLFGQSNYNPCGTEAPGDEWEQWFQTKITEYKKNLASSRIQQTNYVIPVIVHILHDGDDIDSNENIPLRQVQAQIDILNKDFAGIGYNYELYSQINKPSGWPQIANTNITFCLAKQSPNGTLLVEEGVDRININNKPGWLNPRNINSSSLLKEHFDSVIKRDSYWDPSKYLNIWIAYFPNAIDKNNDDNLLNGYAKFPDMTGLPGIPNLELETEKTSGVVIRTDMFGSNLFNFSQPHNLGRTATHEIGHYLGLKHIFSDDKCIDGDDECDDTPAQCKPTDGCPVDVQYQYCGSYCPSYNRIMHMNFMDYTIDSCQYMFTPDQKIRMQTALQYGTYRASLANSPACQVPASPDLIVQNPQISPTTIAPGGQATASCKIKNQGGSNAKTNYTALWLSKDQVFNGSPTDINLGVDISVPALNSGQTSNTLSKQFTLPPGTTSGTWYIMFGADATGVVSEAGGESNNQVFVPITVSGGTCTTPTNNECSGAISLNLSSGSTTCANSGTTVACATQSFAANFCNGTSNTAKDVWFKFTPVSSGLHKIIMTPSTSSPNGWDGVLELFQGSPCPGPSNAIYCSDPSGGAINNVVPLEESLNSGITYYLRVYDFDGSNSNQPSDPSFQLCITSPGSSSGNGDACSSAILINSNNSCNYTYGSVAGATSSGYSIPNCSNYQSTSALDIWYKFTAEASSHTIKVDPEGNTYNNNYLDPVIAIYRGCSSGSLIRCEDDDGGGGGNCDINVSDLKVGDTYYIRLYDYSQGGSAPTYPGFNICVTHTGGGSGGSEDIYLTNVSVSPTTVNTGSDVTAYATMNYSGNQLDDDLPSFNLDYYLSTDCNLSNNDTYLDDDVSGLGSDDPANNEDQILTIPANTPSGTYYILFVADADDELNESNENNNVKCVQITVSGNSGGSEDIYLTNFFVSPTTVNTGSDVTAYATMNYSGNQLDADLPSFNLDYYLSTDCNLSNNDIYLGDDISGLGSDDPANDEDQILTIPANTPSGTYYILFVADADAELNESNENNNFECVQITVGCTSPSTPSTSAASNQTQTGFIANWSSSIGASSYSLDVSTNSSFSSFVSGFNNLNVGNSINYTVSGLNCGSTYYYRVRANNSCGSSSYSETITASTSTCTVTCNAPSKQASNIEFSNIGTNSMRLNWTPGDGEGRIVVIKANSAVTGIPLNGVSYSASTNFGNGSVLNSGEYVVYSGSGSGPITITSLNSGTTYYYRIFEYNCSGTSRVYNTSTSANNPNNYSTTVITPPGNDKCVDAFNIESNGPCASGTVANATGTNGANTCSGCNCTSPDDMDVFYKFTAQSTSHTITLSNYSSDFEGVIGLRKDCPTGVGNHLGCYDAPNPNPSSISNKWDNLEIGKTYYIRIYENNYTGSPPSSPTFTVCVTHDVSTTCSTPGNLSLTAFTETSATLSWTAVSPATNYSYRYRVNGTSSWTTLTTTSISPTINGLTCGTKYEWQVRAQCPSGNSSYSSSSTFSTSTCPATCDIPIGTNQSGVTQTSATLSWNNVSGAQSYSYRYRVSGTSSWTTSNTTSISVNLSNLTCGTTYEWQVRSECSGTISSYTESRSFPTSSCSISCSTPTISTIPPVVSQASANLYWGSVTGATDYFLRYREKGNSSWTTLSTSFWGTIYTSYTLGNLKCGTVYEWQVRANCSGVNSNYSSTNTFSTYECFTPTEPCSSITKINGCGSSSLQTFNGKTIGLWNSTACWFYTGGSESIYSFTAPTTGIYSIQIASVKNDAEVYYSWKSGNCSESDWNCIVRTSNVGQYGQMSWTAGNTYYVLLDNESTFEGTQTFFINCPITCNIPTSLSESSISSTSVNLTWGSVPSASNYSYRYRVNGTSSWTTLTTNSISPTINGLTCGTKYEWQVRAQCSSGNSSYSSSSTFTTLSCPVVCSPPETNFLTIGSPANDLNWFTINLNYSLVNNADAYIYEYSPNGIDNWYAYPEKTKNWESFQFYTPNTPGYFRTKARCGNQYSDYIMGNPFPIYTACSNPDAPFILSSSSNEINFNLPIESTNSNPSYTTYAVYCPTLNQYVQQDGKLGNSPVFLTKIQWGLFINIVGLNPGTEYCFYFMAKNMQDDIRFDSNNKTCVTTDIATPVNMENFSGFNIYPNPNSGIFRVVSDNNITDVVDVSIYNNLGHRIYANLIQPNDSKVDFEINLKSLGVASGIYFLQIRMGKKFISKKIVIEND